MGAKLHSSRQCTRTVPSVDLAVRRLSEPVFNAIIAVFFFLVHTNFFGASQRRCEDGTRHVCTDPRALGQVSLTRQDRAVIGRLGGSLTPHVGSRSVISLVSSRWRLVRPDYLFPSQRVGSSLPDLAHFGSDSLDTISENSI